MTAAASRAVPLVVALSLWCGACGGGEPEGSGDAPAATAPATAESQDTAAVQPRRREPPLPASMVRVSRAASFPHEPHVRVQCSTCHQDIPGHDVHTSIACTRCHRSSLPASAPGPPPEACLGCHHGAEQTRTCTDCHATVTPRRIVRDIQLDVWPQPRARQLPFDHARHRSLACSSCHVDRPGLQPTRACADCHENHHRPDASCMGCHTPPATGAHALSAHLGCGGSGCHADPTVLSLPLSRSFCLVCHQGQVDHEAGRLCADCHRVRAPAPNDALREARPHPAVSEVPR